MTGLKPDGSQSGDAIALRSIILCQQSQHLLGTRPARAVWRREDELDSATEEAM
ncbi:MAG TPA: hypothetical protein VMO26_21610 [Vicinamibacterales bacterium]|nr:hypothetical protein [Vicinamibacterales bacterium]